MLKMPLLQNSLYLNFLISFSYILYVMQILIPITVITRQYNIEKRVFTKCRYIVCQSQIMLIRLNTQPKTYDTYVCKFLKTLVTYKNVFFYVFTNNFLFFIFPSCGNKKNKPLLFSRCDMYARHRGIQSATPQYSANCSAIGKLSVYCIHFFADEPGVSQSC